MPKRHFGTEDNIPWTAYTPTGSWVTNVTYTGMYRVRGDHMDLQAKVLCSGAPTNTELTINMPTGYIITASKVLQTGGSQAALGYGFLHDSGTALLQAVAYYNNNTGFVQVRSHSVSGATLVTSALSTTAPFTWASGDSVLIHASFPVSRT